MRRRVPHCCWLFLAFLLTGCSSGPALHDRVAGVLGELRSAYFIFYDCELIEIYTDDFQVVDPLARLGPSEAGGGVETFRRHGTLDRAAYAEMLGTEMARLGRIVKAKFIFDGIEEDDEGWAVLSQLDLYAVSADGTRIHELSRHRFQLVERDEVRDGKLTIRRHQVLARTRTTASGPTQFLDRAQDLGLDVVHRMHYEVDADTPVVPGRFSGSGASAGDVDGDGWLDVVLGDGKRFRLFRNLGGRLQDVTESSGLPALGAVRGAYLVDIDNDGKLDLFLTRINQTPAAFRNLGGWRFEDRSEAFATLCSGGQDTSAAFADVDGDGDLDIYVVQYGEFEETSWAWPLYNSTDGRFSVALRNDGDWRFARVDDPVLTPRGWGLAAAFADFDDDGDQDLYIVNDFGVNHLLRNDTPRGGAWRFVDVTAEARIADQGFGMSAAWGDADGDGRLDMYIANMFSSSRWIFADPEFPIPVAAKIFMLRGHIMREMAKVTRGNSLFLNGPDGRFRQVAAERRVERAYWAWGANYLDYDNDGDLDIYSPNGFITGESSKDM